MLIYVNLIKKNEFKILILVLGSIEKSFVRLFNKVEEENGGKKRELKVFSIDFVGFGFVDKKSIRGFLLGLVFVEDYFVGGDLFEVEFIVGDKIRFDKIEKKFE